MVAVSYGDYGDYGLVTQAEFWKLCRHNIPHDTGTHTAVASVPCRTPGQDSLLPAVAASRTTAQDMKVLMVVSCCAHRPLTMLDSGSRSEH